MVVVEAGRFTFCPGDRNDLEEISLDELLLWITPDEAAIGQPDVPFAATDLDLTVLHPGRAVATRIEHGALRTYLDGNARWVDLTTPHLRAIALLTSPSTMGELLVQSGLEADELSRVVDDLNAAGIVSVEHREPAATPPPVEPEGQHLSDQDRSTATVGGPRPAAQGLMAWITRRWSAGRAVQEPQTPATATEPADQVPPPERSDPDRVPVYSFWATSEGPHMGGAAVVAYARVHDGGRLNDVYDFRMVQPPAEVLDDLAARTGPAVLLCSDYLWSVEANLDVARQALALNPELVVVHGGPSAPRGATDCEELLRSLGERHVVVSGEGELTLAAALAALADSASPRDRLDVSRLRDVEGLSYVDPSDGVVIVNEQRDRHDKLEDFPSPLLSGEFDLVPLDVVQRVSVPIETVRGCPYGCTFCDWGQATMTRIRKFPMERIKGELDWLAEREVDFWVVADANWGMLPRDLEVAEYIAELHGRTGYPKYVGAGPPKNSTDRYVSIVDTLLTGGVSLKAAIALQSRDQDTLDAVRRSNIPTATYDRIVDEMRRRGLPLHCELMLGLPGATVESLKADLQWCLEENIRPHMYRTFVLPNAPMNDPDYKAEHGVVVEDGMVVTTNSYSRAEGVTMWRLAYAYQALELLGLCRYTLRYLQWDCGRRAMDVVHDLLDAVDAAPDEFPLMAFVLRHYEQFIVPPVGWTPFFEELHRLLTTRLGVADGPELAAVLEVDLHTVPWPGRATPYTIDLAYDVVDWFRTNNRINRWTTSGIDADHRPLGTYPPGQLVVVADPDEVAVHGLGRQIDVGTEVFPGFITAFWEVCHLELLSPLVVYEPMSHRFVEMSRELLPRVELDGQPVDLGGTR